MDLYALYFKTALVSVASVLLAAGVFFALMVLVLGLAVVLGTLPWLTGSFWLVVSAFVAFFVAFNILEALQPSLVSRVAPPAYKGLALGFYNTSQSLGVFAGGVLGGLLARGGGPSMVFWAGAMLAAVWLYTARGFKDGR